MTTPSSFRLPSNVRPICYHITLTPDLDAFSFTGEEWVEIDILEPLSEIVVNATELQVSTATLNCPTGISSTLLRSAWMRILSGLRFDSLKRCQPESQCCALVSRAH